MPINHRLKISRLVDALHDELQARKLYEQACVEDKPDNELSGGKNAEATLPHFIRRFKASAARVDSKPHRAEKFKAT